MTGQKLDSLSQWNEKAQRVNKSHPNVTRLNNFLLSELAKANNKALEMEAKGYVSAQDVKVNLKPVDEVKIYFQEIAQQRLNELTLIGNYDVLKSDSARLKRFYEFINHQKLLLKI